MQIHGGASSSSYTNANYILGTFTDLKIEHSNRSLVDPRSAAGQNLYIQFYNNKKGKTILDSRWVKECVQAKELLAWRSNWAGCRVTGKERSVHSVLHVAFFICSNTIGMSIYKPSKPTLNPYLHLLLLQIPPMSMDQRPNNQILRTN